ncbi:MAG: M81 family metallopeptidase [Rhodothermales bacterium]
MKKRVAIAGIFHETHTFVPSKTTRPAFRWRLGTEILEARGDASPLDGVLEIANKCDWDLLPLIDINAAPGGVVANEVIEEYWEILTRELLLHAPRGIDGVCLVLHGAMVSEDCDDVEGETLARVRKIVGSRTPICGVLDLHANVTPVMARYSDGLIAYRENPHTDAREAAGRAAMLLDSLMHTDVSMKTFYQRAPIIWPPEGTATESQPMLGLEEMAREFESTCEGVFAVNICPGFAFADTACTGLSFSVISSGPESEAQEILRCLTDHSVEHRNHGIPDDSMSLDAVLPHITGENVNRKGPVVLVEPADNIGGGAPGDGTTILRFFLANQLTNCAVILNDAEAVEELESVPIGEQCRLEIGGKQNPFDEGPVDVEITLLKLTDGNFELEDRRSHLASMLGNGITMGRSALVDCQGNLVLLTSRAIPPFDLGQWRCMGVNPAELRAIAVKAAVGHKRAYDPIAQGSCTVDTPGVCPANLSVLPYERIQRPVYPLDDISGCEG